MNSRQRVQLTLAHKEPDRVPIDLWASREVKERLPKHFGLATWDALLDHWDVDLRVVFGPRYIGPPLRHTDDGISTDLWGVTRREVAYGQGATGGIYREVLTSPLAGATTVKEVEDYPGWPSPDWWDYESIAAQCEALGGRCVVNAGDRLDRTAQLKTMMYLRGIEQIMYDMVVDPAIVDAMLERIVSYFIEYDRRVFQSAQGRFDIFMMGDDFGMQTGPLVSPDMWRRFFKPGFRAYIELAHSFGLKVMHHTCGSVRDLIPDFIDCGLDILQSLQPRARGMDLAELKREYGSDLAFHGGVDIQQTMPYGTPDDVRLAVRDLMEHGKPHGGYIICTAHNLQLDVPVDNISAMLESYHEYGRY